MDEHTEQMPSASNDNQPKPSPDDLVGKSLGHYEILAEVGRGGMATVYRARQTSINRIVALKVLPPSLMHDPNFFERFQREVDVIAHLEHPHILPIYDYGQVEGIPFIVMRYLAGGSLSQMIRRGSIPLEWLEKPLTQVAQALDHAHRQGIIHRDLKPGNVMLDEQGNAYLSDFGIARVLGSEMTGSMLIGTPAYMSPEQANGQPIDGRADIYSLGIVLFELITGSEPYQAETPLALLFKQINEPLPSLSAYRKDVPEAMQDVIDRATAKNPNDRFASAREFAQAFRNALHGEVHPTGTQASHEDAATILPGSEAPLKIGQPTTQLPSETAAQATPHDDGKSFNVWKGIIIPGIFVAVGLVIVLVLLFLDDSLLGGSDDIESFATQAAVQPTPFAGAQIVETQNYSISIPAQWIPPQQFEDNSTSQRMMHIWRARDNSAMVDLALVESNGAITDADNFAAAIARYDEMHYADDDTLRLIGETVADDGSVVRSYRVEGRDNLPFGQMDVIYMERAPFLAVLEVYSADSTANTLVPTFQLILDSLQIKNNA
ncbi:MAG: serine/threonine protein kinase [Chloroflexi bacterium]|nr:MAG: serine/threonine protein kinase [Chloroflexota bacterium]